MSQLQQVHRAQHGRASSTASGIRVRCARANQPERGLATKDVDVLILGQVDPSLVRTAVRRVAGALALPDDWLNDAAKGYVHGLALGDVLIDEPTLLVRALAPHQLLAMKLSAWRDDVDIDDARLLLGKLSGDRDTVWGLVEPHVVPGRETKAYLAFCDLWEAEHGST